MSVRDLATIPSAVRMPSRTSGVPSVVRNFLLVEGVLTILVGTQLFIFSSDTEPWFPWITDPPLTEAFLTENFFAGMFLVLTASRQRSLSAARVTLTGVLVSATLTRIRTMLHIDRFQLDASEP